MKRLVILVSVALLLVAGAVYFNSTYFASIPSQHISSSGGLLFPIVAIAALVDSINPCAISVLLLTIAFLFSLGRLRSRILKAGFSYILGIFLMYLLIGLGILQTLNIFGVPHFMAKFGATLLVILGVISLINEFWPSFPVKLGIPHSAHRKIAELMEKGSVPTAFILGAFVGLCEFPCTGGPYLVVLGLLHDSQTYFLGFGYLVFYNLIFVLPLVALLLVASDGAVLAKVHEWRKTNMKGMRFWGGIAMILLGVLIFVI